MSGDDERGPVAALTRREGPKNDTARHGDARQTSPPHRGDLRAGRLQPHGGVVQAGGRSELLLRGQGVRLAVRHPEVTVRQESRAGAVRQRGVRVHCAQFHPEDDGQWSPGFVSSPARHALG